MSEVTHKKYFGENISRVINAFKKEEKGIESVNYTQLIPNSHFWTSIEMLINWIKQADDKAFDKNFLIKGLENTLKNGYQLLHKDQKVDECDATKV